MFVHMQEKTWGVAYKVEPKDEEEVLSYLNFREKNGYVQLNVLFHPLNDETKPFPVMLYVGTESNEHFLGDDTLENIALQISRSTGPSGANTEYLFRLAEAMRTLCPEVADDHLFRLETAVRSIGAAPSPQS